MSRKKGGLKIRIPYTTLSWDKIKRDALKRKFGLIRNNNIEHRRKQKKLNRADHKSSLYPAEENLEVKD